MAVDQIEEVTFAHRLKHCIERRGLKVGPTEVAKQFGYRYPDLALSVHGVRKWLVGESLPSHPRIVALASWLDVEPAWLEYGDGVSALEARQHAGIDHFQDGLRGMIDLLDAKERLLVKEFTDILLRARSRSKQGR